MNLISPASAAQDLHVGIVVARFNAFITEPLLQGSLKALERQGVAADRIDVVWAPGAFEIPLLLKAMATSARQYDALIALGCVIRGDTAHFEYVCSACTEGVTRISLDHQIPVGFGVLTTDTTDQATQRAGDNRDNKGLEAALAALETCAVQKAVADLQVESSGGSH